MSSVVAIITDAFLHQTLQIPFLENDPTVEQFSTTVPDPSLRDTVLPWIAEAGSLRLDTEAPRCFDHFIVQLCAAIKNQVAGPRVSS
jgi:hypothetical protein